MLPRSFYYFAPDNIEDAISLLKDHRGKRRYSLEV